MSRASWRGADGFSLADIVVTVAIGAVMTAVAVPVGSSMIESTRLVNGTRMVERELQSARLGAVSKNRSMRVRLNCPSPGRLRVIQVTGVAATDTATDRCNESLYPYPGPADSDPATPAHDGPVRTLDRRVSVTGPDIEFSARGTASVIAGGVRQPIGSLVTITVTHDVTQSLLKVNRLGRITKE